MKVNNRLPGVVHGNAVQAGKIGNVTFNGHHNDPGPKRKSNWKAEVVALLVMLALAALFLPSILSHHSNHSPAPFPEEHGTRPAGATDKAVRAAVSQKLQQCAKAVVIKPENCPQSVSGDYASDIQWSLVGDPIDGAMLAWHDDRFHVRGAAVMAVEYKVSTVPMMWVEVVGYQAEVLWRERRPALEKIYAMNAASIGSIRKRDPTVSADQITSAVRNAFDNCIASTVSPMPPECPARSASPSARQVTWNLGGDPLLNTRQTFDPVSGLIHVIGSYAATARYQDINYARWSAPVSGSYDALIISDSNGLRVLQVRDA